MRRGLSGLALVVGTLLLPGCTKNIDMANLFPSIPDVLNAKQWEGQPLQAAINQFGEPTDIIKDANNQSVARWRYIRTSVSSTGFNTLSAGPGPGGVTVTPNTVQRVSSRECRLELTYDARHTITNFTTWKSYPGGCNDYSFKKRDS